MEDLIKKSSHKDFEKFEITASESDKIENENNV